MRNSYTFPRAHYLGRHSCLSYSEQIISSLDEFTILAFKTEQRTATSSSLSGLNTDTVWLLLRHVASLLRCFLCITQPAVTLHFTCSPDTRGFISNSPHVICLWVNLSTVCPKGRCPAETGRVKIILLYTYSITSWLGFACYPIFRNRTQYFGSSVYSRLQVRGTSLVH
jgi:hypothetical protein